MNRTARTPAEFVTELFDLYARKGESRYDEDVTQTAHALQCAALAQIDGDDQLVVACLLHDVGHLVLDEHEDDPAFLHRDLRHEDVGAGYLSAWFDERVTTPIRLHVPAKRYLCTIDPAYHDGLSRASQRSLELQGGRLPDAERAAFEDSPHAERAVLLRRFDDRAKVPDLVVPPLATYGERLLRTINAAG